MKRFLFYLTAVTAMFFTSCTKDETTPPPIVEPPAPATVGLYVLNEGTWGQGNSQLTYYDLASSVATHDYYGKQNDGAKIGDTATDMLIYGSKLYIAVNVSNKVLVLNADTGKKLAEIDLGQKDGNDRQPRYLAAAGGKVFVSTYYDGVNWIDTTYLTRQGTIPLTEAFSEGLCVLGDNLYVANAGRKGDSFGGKGTTVSVVSLATFSETGTITVPANPNRIEAGDDGKLYLSCWGDFLETEAQLYRIDPAGGTAEKVTDTPVSKFAVDRGYAYTYNFSWITDDMENWKIDLKTGEETVFIADPREIGLRSIYDVCANPLTGMIYYLDKSGLVVAFSSDGTEQFRIEDNGIRTNTVVFLNK